MTNDYFRAVLSNNDKDIFKSVKDIEDIDQMFAEELENYFDCTNKTQAESLLMMFNEMYRLGYEQGYKTSQVNKMFIGSSGNEKVSKN